LTGGAKKKKSSKKKSTKIKSRKKKSSKKKSSKKKSKRKAKREGPAFLKLYQVLLKMIKEKDSINHPQAMKKAKEYMTKALGKPYEKGGDIAYIDAIQKTIDMLKK